MKDYAAIRALKFVRQKIVVRRATRRRKERKPHAGENYRVSVRWAISFVSAFRTIEVYLSIAIEFAQDDPIIQIGTLRLVVPDNVTAICWKIYLRFAHEYYSYVWESVNRNPGSHCYRTA